MSTGNRYIGDRRSPAASLLSSLYPLYPTMLGLRAVKCLHGPRWWLRAPLDASRGSQARHAHAAMREDPDIEPHASTSQHGFERPEPSTSAAHKGKTRARPMDFNTDSYSFPLHSAGRAPPDPFQILGLQRTASEADVKKRCKSLVSPPQQWELNVRLPPR